MSENAVLAEWHLGPDRVVARRAVAEDLPQLVALLRADPLGASREVGEGADLAVYRRAFAAIDIDPGEILVVVTCGELMVGTTQVSFLPGLARRGAWRGQLEAVRVLPSWRGRGVGRAMISWGIEESRRRGCSVVQLTTDKSRQRAHSFYASLGFVASHEGLKLVLP